ncbi:chorismate-binding protein [Myroides fluvii]|uniref:chorismate-binding protein n=1 Tax=Myroides fluvii TaxID=2572594 RepID=UPI00131D5E22|nr:chorismate-binding protein [Myroides fluvii]
MRLYETWAQQIVADKPFVLYRKPGQAKVVGLFQQDTTLHQVEHFTESGFILAPFYEGIRFYIPLAHAEKIEEEIAVEAVDFLTFDLDYEAQPAKVNFEDLVSRCIEAIKQGQFSKVVPARKEKVAVEVKNIQALFSKLLMAYPEAFCSVVYHPQIGLWMGATPETLVELTDNKVHTMALAGTQVNHGKDEVHWGEKEKEEQRYVTAFIVEKLKPLTQHIQVSEPFTKRAAKVMHICTSIEAELKEVDLKTVVEALHPTPAVCGMPKEVSRDFLLQQEEYSRKYYAGYLGELNCPTEAGQQNSKLFVNLRCMEIEKEHVNLYIGCGVTEDSDPTSEFVETVNKSTTMKKILF